MYPLVGPYVDTLRAHAPEVTACVLIYVDNYVIDQMGLG
jgi:hypothetical protein